VSLNSIKKLFSCVKLLKYQHMCGDIDSSFKKLSHKRNKVKILSGFVVPVFTRGCECWPLSTALRTKIERAEIKF